MSVAKVCIKVPPFWKPDPKIWFIQLRSIIQKYKNEQTKYDYVISSIEPDILLNPPQDNKYQAIKNRLISLYADSETQKT
ncbi:hypothetical protein X975_19456, partial [Stegodyphus mimosarum]